ncbi:MAG: hypothetical protein ACE5LU_17180 [Anaerolineae bacterium]
MFVEAGQIAQAYALLDPVLAERTPFPMLRRIGAAVGAGPLEAVNAFLEHIAAARTIGGWVVISSALEAQLDRDLAGAFARCRRFIIAGSVWHAADTLGEFEPRSPGVKRRLQAMEQLASAGILVGTALIPILPFVGDDEGHLEDVVRATKEHGGSFVLAGSLTMDGVQAERTLEAARRFDPALEARFRQLYDWKPGGKPNYSPPRAYQARLGLLVRELCARHGLLDRMPRYVAPGPLAVNKRIAERLFLRLSPTERREDSGPFRPLGRTITLAAHSTTAGGWLRASTEHLATGSQPDAGVCRPGTRSRFGRMSDPGQPRPGPSGPGEPDL